MLCSNDRQGLAFLSMCAGHNPAHFHVKTKVGTTYNKSHCIRFPLRRVTVLDSRRKVFPPSSHPLCLAHHYLVSAVVLAS
jgi:hypothetical protein